jgi:hypothetical protein
MLLHELPKKTAYRLQKSVTWTDLPVRPESIALYGLMKGLARRTWWLAPRGTSLLRFAAHCRARFSRKLDLGATAHRREDESSA